MFFKTTKWKEIPNGIEGLTALVFDICLLLLWANQCIYIQPLADSCSGSLAAWERLWLCSWYLTTVTAATSTHTHLSTISFSQAEAEDKWLVFQNIEVLLVSFTFLGFLFFPCTEKLFCFSPDKTLSENMLTSALILITPFVSVDCFMQSLCTRTIYYIFHMDSTLKQTKDIVLFFSRPQRLICCFFEYKCLWGPIKSVRCNTECNISAVAIAWLARLRLGQNACKDKLHQAVWVWQRERIGADLLNFQWEKREKNETNKHYGVFSYESVFMTFCLFNKNRALWVCIFLEATL